MKKILTIMAMAMGAMLVHGQGYIIVQSSTADITTNGTGSNPGENGSTSGKTATAANGYYYALLYDTTAPSGGSSPTNPQWSVVTQEGGAALAINNYGILSGGTTGTGTSGGVETDLAAGTTYTVEIVGWSASLGTTWAQVEAQVAGGYTAAGYFGSSVEETITPFATAGAGDPAIFPTVFPAGSLVLNGVSQAVPEPASIAMAALGGLALLGLRRKK